MFKHLQLARFLLVSTLLGFSGLAFVVTSVNKGTFHTDEPGNVMMTLNSYQSPYQVFHYAAITSQPPLDHFVRTYIWSYWGKRLPIFKQYPELFQRGLSFVWWLLPVGYFCWYLKSYQEQTALGIYLGLVLMITSQFFQFYLAEARHYSAVVSVITTLILIYLVDRIPLARVRWHFFAFALLLPLLHLISFPYCVVLVMIFVLALIRENKLTRSQIVIYLVAYLVYWLMAVKVYTVISQISAVWQNPSWGNVVGKLDYSNVYFYRTLGWLFRGTIFFPFYRAIPAVISHHFLTFFVLLTPFSLLLVWRWLKGTQKKLSLFTLMIVMIAPVWLLTFFAVVYRSNYFIGERYSIALVPFIMLFLGSLITDFASRLNNRYVGRGFLAVIVLFSVLSVFRSLHWPLQLTTPENQLIHDRPDLFRDPTITMVFDNGTYSESFLTLALINKIGYRLEGLSCRSPLPEGKKDLNKLLASRSKVYLFGPYQDFMTPDNIVWRYQDYALYRLTTAVPDTYLCLGESTDECYNRCLKSRATSTDRRFFKYTSPHTDIYGFRDGEEWIP